MIAGYTKVVTEPHTKKGAGYEQLYHTCSH
jgi:hypothetical protein